MRVVKATCPRGPEPAGPCRLVRHHATLHHHPTGKVIHRPAGGSHGFSVPFRNVRLRVEDRTLRIILGTGNRELVQFKTQDAESAAAVAQLWGKLKALER